MSVMITLEMPVKPDMLEDYLNILKGALVETRAYKAVSYTHLTLPTILLV